MSSAPINNPQQAQLLSKLRSPLKKVLGFFLIVMGTIGILFFGFEHLTYSSLDRTIEKNWQIESAFKTAKKFTDQFIEINQRLPTASEFKLRPKPDLDSYDQNMNLNTAAEPFPERLGPENPNSYYLSLWRGEWTEFYAAWNDKSTLIFDQDDYLYVRSFKLNMLLLFLSFAFVLTGITFQLKPKRPT